MALKELVPLPLQPYTLHTLFHTDRLAQRHRRHRLNHFLFVHGSRHPSGFGPGGVDVAGIPGFRCPHVLHVVRHKFHMISQDGDQSFLLHTHTHSSSQLHELLELLCEADSALGNPEVACWWLRWSLGCAAVLSCNKLSAI